MKRDENGQRILSTEVTKMQKGWKKIGLVLVSLGLALALILGSVVPSQAAPAEERVVKMGVHGVFTGPIADIGVPMSRGVIDYLRYVNEQGGIDGVKVDIKWEDTRAEVPRAITAHKRFKVAGVVIEWCCWSSQLETLAPAMQRDETPFVAYNTYTPAMWTDPLRWIFVPFPSWDCVAQVLGDWVKKNWTEERPPRIGYIFHDHPSAWGTKDGFVEYAPEGGAEFIGYEVVPMMGTIDTSTEWLRMARKRPDWIYVFAYGTTMVTLVKDADRLEIREKGIKLFAGPSCVDEASAKVMGKSAEGWYTLLPTGVNSQIDELLGIKTAVEAGVKYRGYKPEGVSLGYIGGWNTAQIMVEGVRIALEKVEYENLTGHDVRDALCSIRNFDTGLLPSPSTITNERPWFADEAFIFILKKGRLWAVDQMKATWYPSWLREKLGLE